MSDGRITELRLTSFKSFSDATIPLEPRMLLIGRNGSVRGGLEESAPHGHSPTPARIWTLDDELGDYT